MSNGAVENDAADDQYSVNNGFLAGKDSCELIEAPSEVPYHVENYVNFQKCVISWIYRFSATINIHEEVPMRKRLLMMVALMLMMLFVTVPVFAEEKEGYPFEVGKNVWAKIEDTDEGKILVFNSKNGTLDKYWSDEIDLDWDGWDKVKHIRFASESSKMFLPKDSSWLFNCMYYVQDIDLSKMDTTNVTDMSRMFGECCSLVSLDLSGFNTSHVTNMEKMFYECSSLTNLDLSSFDTSMVTNMGDMFNSCSILKSLDVSSFDISKATEMADFVSGCDGLYVINTPNFRADYNADNLPVLPFAMNDDLGHTYEYMPMSSVRLTLEEPEGYPYQVGAAVWAKTEDTDDGKVLLFNSKNGTLHGYWGDECDLDWNEVKHIRFASESNKMFLPQNSSWIFSGMDNVQEIDLSKLDTSKVTNMNRMFAGCSNLVSLNLSSFDTSHVTNMKEMFHKCSSLTNLDLKSFDTSMVTSMNHMFSDCSGLKNLNVSSFNTRNTKNMDFMFSWCSSLTSLDLSSFELSYSTGTYDFLVGCNNLSMIKTPNLITSEDISLPLPFEMYDIHGNAYTQMPNSSMVLTRNNPLATLTPEPTKTPTPTSTPTPTEKPAEPTVTPTPTEKPAEPTVTPTPTEKPVEPMVTPTPTEKPAEPTAEPTATPTPTVVPIEASLRVSNITTKANVSKSRTATLKVAYTGDGELTFASNNPKIKVDADGRITIPKNYAGSAIITVKAAATERYAAAEAKMKVTVKRLANTITANAVTKVSATEAQSFKLSVQQKGTGKLTYKSSNKSVKVTNAGTVTISKNYSGRATISITAAAAGAYSTATKTVQIAVRPAKITSGAARNSAAGKIFLAWKNASGAEGYQIQYSTSKDFKSKKSGTTKNLRAALSKLTKGKTYYVRIRAYKRDADGNLFSAWTKFKALKITQ